MGNRHLALVTSSFVQMVSMALALGSGQKEVEWSLDSHLHQTTGLGREAWTWGFPALLWKLKFCTPGVGWDEREW